MSDIEGQGNANKKKIIKPRKKRKRLTIKDVRGLIEEWNGNLAAVARKTGYSRTRISRYVHEDHPELLECLDDARASMRDNVQSEFYRSCIDRKQQGHVTAMIFFLKTQCGWKEQSEKDADSSLTDQRYYLPAYMIAHKFVDVYRDITAHKHTEYIFQGGRGSTKSSFSSLVIIEQLLNNPNQHALVVRQVYATARDSVYSQLVWAINMLGLTDKFKMTVNPLEITYLPTRQKIYFRGADDPLKLKSIKPQFGYIGILWFEELDQFRGQSQIRNIVQSAIRGGDTALILKSLNPPRSKNNWTYKELQIPKNNRYVHTSCYLDAPPEWLGKVFFEEAEFLKEVNYPAYEHEYLGVANSQGGLVFPNVVIREITDPEIEQFDRIHHGLDWGYYPHPAHYVKMHFDAARLKLYIYGEVRRWKHGNRKLYDSLVEYGITRNDLLICDSAEPKSIADFREYGANARGAEKGPGSVDYSMKWLQSLVEIVIDNVRAPYAAQEFLAYEYEIDKDGNYISEYPDKDNHAIDGVRYGMNNRWKRRGQ